MQHHASKQDLGLSDSRGWKRLSIGPRKTWFVTLQISEGNKISHCNYISSGWYVNSGFGNWVKSWLSERKWIEIYSALDLGMSDSKCQFRTLFFFLLHQFISRMIPSESFQIDMGMYEANSSASYSSRAIYNQEVSWSCKHWSVKSAELHCELGKLRTVVLVPKSGTFILVQRCRGRPGHSRERSCFSRAVVVNLDSLSIWGLLRLLDSGMTCSPRQHWSNQVQTWQNKMSFAMAHTGTSKFEGLPSSLKKSHISCRNPMVSALFEHYGDGRRNEGRGMPQKSANPYNRAKRHSLLSFFVTSFCFLKSKRIFLIRTKIIKSDVSSPGLAWDPFFFFFFPKTAVTMLLHIILFLKPNFNLMLWNSATA